MAEIHVVKMQGCLLRPATQYDNDLLKVWRVGDVLRSTIVKPRNGKFHCKGMSLLQEVFNNQERFGNMTALMDAFKLESGHYEWHESLSGKTYPKPKSIAFDKMDDAEFSLIYSKWIDIAMQNFMEGMTAQEIHNHIDKILGYA
ncbi:MAG: DUF1367 family protein [Gallionellaceae bacterium]